MIPYDMFHLLQGEHLGPCGGYAVKQVAGRETWADTCTQPAQFQTSEIWRATPTTTTTTAAAAAADAATVSKAVTIPVRTATLATITIGCTLSDQPVLM